MSADDRGLVKAMGRTGAVFFRSFPALRDSQRAAIPPVLKGINVLLACQTASGKTEALFAPLIASILSRKSSTDRVRLLAIAPTRALVNDLFKRLEPALIELGLSCRRQTSDHRLGNTPPFLVITTPESLDSMLARRSIYGQDGRPAGHELDGVEAVFIDEAHLFDNTARGDQLLWLLARLQRLRRGVNPDLGERSDIQICAASATVSSPEALARRLMGADSQVVTVPGGRELLLYAEATADRWLPIGEDHSVDSIYDHILPSEGAESVDALANLVWRAMADGGEKGVRKVLVFVPSRGLCDELSTALGQYLKTRRNVAVFAHHGSLDKRVREDAEQGFGSARDAVLVATSTLEVGVDIGDVDAVVLVGPPPDTNGLLQRIGRSGRRLGITRVVAIVRSPMDRFAMASMLLAARDGLCDPVRYGRRWSVCVQQISSYVRQGPSIGRRVHDITDLCAQVWPDAGAASGRAIVEHLVQQGLLEWAPQERIRFGEAWQDLWDGMGMHGNIDGSSGGTPVVDARTGDTLAYIPTGSKVPQQISIAGANWNVIVSRGEILLQGINVAGARGAIRYGSRRRGPVSRVFARHVALGMGFDERDVVSLRMGDERFVFHFGGSVYERLIAALFAGWKPLPGLTGVALSGDSASFLQGSFDPSRAETVLAACLKASPGLVSPGPYHRHLPETLQIRTLQELMPVEDFISWIRSRRLVEVEVGSLGASRLSELLQLR